MRTGVIATLLVAVALIPIASAAELQVSAAPEAASTVTVGPSAGAGVDVGSGTESTSNAETTNVATKVPSEYYTLASNLTQSLCDALSKGAAAVIDYLRGQAYHEPVRPEDLVGAIVLSAFKTVLDSYFHSESFQKPLNEFHLKLVQIIGPNVSLMQLLGTIETELQENLKEAIKSLGPIATFYDTIEDALKSASGKEKAAYDSAKSDLDGMVDDLAKYASDIFCMILSKCFPFEVSLGALSS